MTIQAKTTIKVADLYKSTNKASVLEGFICGHQWKKYAQLDLLG